MKYTQLKIEQAFSFANDVLAKYRFPGMEGRELFQFRKAALQTVQFLAEERNKLINQYAPKRKADNVWEFKNPETRTAFINELNEIENMEIEMEMCPLKLRMPGDAEFNQEDWEIMDGIIELYEPEEKEPEIQIGDVEMVSAEEAEAIQNVETVPAEVLEEAK